MKRLIRQKRSYSPRAFRLQGFTLIEVLVAMLITSFGLLGIAGLVVTSLRYNQTAAQRSAATQLVVDMMDRMRANSWAVVDANGVAKTTYMRSTGQINAPGVNCTGINAPSCTSDQVAASDLYDWKQTVINQLPGGQGAVRWDPGNTRRVQIVVAWKEAGKSDKNWDASAFEAHATNGGVTNSYNVCPSVSGLTIDSTVRCYVAVFYP